MTQPDLATWLARKPSQKKPRKPLRKRTPKRAKEERQYNKRVKEFLEENPVCQVWLKENGWFEIPDPFGNGGKWYNTENNSTVTPSEQLLRAFGAPRSTQCHHMNKRRGARLLDERYWLAVCDENHKRIENNKAWARENGYLLNF